MSCSSINPTPGTGTGTPPASQGSTSGTPPVNAISVTPSPPPEVDTAPALVVTEEGQKPLALGISTVKAEVRIVGYIAETRMTMVFTNPHKRNLAGDLFFPLPEGAVVSGYALDVNGMMVDGVIVGKEKGRQVFEKEVRKGVDPGLAEWVKGNNFRTRVFPIPPGGSRTVMVRYVSDVAVDKEGATYRLPLNFREKLQKFTVHLEVVKGETIPVMKRGGPPNMTFSRWQDSFVADGKITNAPVTEQMIIFLPDLEKKPVAVEQGSDGSCYFCINDYPADPRGAKPQNAVQPSTLTIFWDASGSSAKADHKREYAFLKSYFTGLGKKPVKVNLVLFRNEMAPPKKILINNGDPAPLISELEKAACDGGTQMGCLAPPGGLKSDMTFLFTDGNSNFGKEEPAALPRPLYIFSADASANHSFLHYCAMQSGGTYFNLLQTSDEQVNAGMRESPFSFLGAEATGATSVEIYPEAGKPVYGRFAVAGSFRGDSAQITVKYGAAGQTLTQRSFTVSAADAPKGELLKSYWGQKKVEALSIFAKKNEQEIVAVGQQCGLVTPFTSLIVLERLEQYIEHRIAPPGSLKNMHIKYISLMEKEKSGIKKKEAQKIEHVLALWKARVAWWEKEFKYPGDFKVQQTAPRTSADSGGAGPGGGGSYGSNPRPSGPQVHAPATMTPQAPRPGGTTMDGGGETKLEKSESFLGGENKKGAAGLNPEAQEPSIEIKEWDPQTPYMKKLKAASPEKLFDTYIELRKEYGTSPAFFLDCGDYLKKIKQDALAVQVYSNIAELDLENAAALRILAYRLKQIGKTDPAILLFEEAKKLRPEEPQSWRDLALALAERGRTGGNDADFIRAMELLSHVVMNRWDRFDEIEVVALMDLNAIWADFTRRFPKSSVKPPVDRRLVKLLDLDIRILLTWDADMTDIDLHVVEPSGEEAYYGHNLTTIGGLVSRDFTQGYGPEEYCLHRAMSGVYRINVNYYGSSAATPLGPVTVQAEVITGFGRPGEKHQSLTLRLDQAKETVNVGEIRF